MNNNNNETLMFFNGVSFGLILILCWRMKKVMDETVKVLHEKQKSNRD